MTSKLALIGLPKILFEMIRTYFRVEIEGLEYVPRRGKALITPNHSGCSGLDAIMLGHVIHRELQRVPRILALWTAFQHFPFLEGAARKMGLKEANSKSGLEGLKKNNLTILFPEGVSGSFKPSSERYHLQSFHTGFIRMALLTGAPIIPCVIIGAEESNINLGTLHLGKSTKEMAIPVPLNIIPLPAKWKIRFLPPVDMSDYSIQDAHNKETMQHAANRIRQIMQRSINQELLKRKYVYFGENRLIGC